ncbi:hypothetical protein J6O86_08560 [bacterium]|nr:hypothetical protein [bacterium]
MKVQKILSDYLHGSIKKSAGDWDDIANVPDITDSFTDERKNPFDKEFWDEKILTKPSISDLSKEQDKKILDIFA